MFGLVKQSEVQQLRKEIEQLKQEIAVVRYSLDFTNREVHGAQAALYSLINNLDRDLVLNSNDEPEVIKRKGAK